MILFILSRCGHKSTLHRRRRTLEGQLLLRIIYGARVRALPLFWNDTSFRYNHIAERSAWNLVSRDLPKNKEMDTLGVARAIMSPFLLQPLTFQSRGFKKCFLKCNQPPFFSFLSPIFHGYMVTRQFVSFHIRADNWMHPRLFEGFNY